MNYLTKSDFKIAQSCPTKLYYKKQQYPTKNDANDYMAMLADGGFLIGALAKVLYPDGINIENSKGSTGAAIEITERLLASNENITLFEAAIVVNNQLVIIDILEKKGNHFNLIEVKSKSYSSKELQEESPTSKYWLGSKFKEFKDLLEDVAFQKKVLQEKFPQTTISVHLLMPDKSKTNEHEGLINWFHLSKKAGDVAVDFVGSDENAEQLRASNFMGLECVDEAVNSIIADLSDSVKGYLDALKENRKIDPPISSKCKDCEYRVEGERSGFVECWGTLAETKPHILDLAQLGNINRQGAIDALIADNKASISDIPIDILLKDTPYYNDRPLFQRAFNQEFLLDGIREAIATIEYPLHFIDFETCQMPTPFHAGMRPYENVIFQWSCHTLHADGRIEHQEWLNTDDFFPNVEFARSLRNCIGAVGTVMTWSSYEKTQLKSVAATLEQQKSDDTDLIDWLSAVEGRLLDLNKVAIEYYFHPNMGGKTSIKAVLPSVLRSSQSAKIKAWLTEEHLYASSGGGGIQDPYALLEEQLIDATKNFAVSVRNGGEAMLAYRDMMYGLSKDDTAVKEAYSTALLRYCKLDTLAMVIIWEHWQDLLAAGTPVTTREKLIATL